MNNKSIKTMLDSAAGKDLKDFLRSQMNKLNRLDTLKKLDDPTELAIEVKAQRKAASMLWTILSEIATLEGLPKGQPPKNNYYAF